MHTLIAFLLFICFQLPVWGDIPASSFKVMPPINVIYHPVSTLNPEAQRNFDQGLTYIYAFNHDIAYESFKKAAELDPGLAMAYWGMALALGQNINSDVTAEKELKCYSLIQHALLLSSSASQNEQAYINALATRYTNDPSVDFTPFRFFYRDAMKKVVERYPEDLDAATLYSESILNLYPWKWWFLDGKPKPGTEEAAELLLSVLRRNPWHIGANHYYIHALEESPYPERPCLLHTDSKNFLVNPGIFSICPVIFSWLLATMRGPYKQIKRLLPKIASTLKPNGSMESILSII